jgi:hypothetical protein
MRTRSIVLVVAILLVAGFAALNWSEMVRPSPLLFGPVVMDAPLGAILLGLLAITLVLFLASTAAMRTQSLMDYRHQQKTLDEQRALADRAEASRFNELRSHIDEHLRAVGERDAMASAEFDKAMLANRREMQQAIEQINRTISARLNELEHRIESRLERNGIAHPRAAVHSSEAQPTTEHEHPVAQQARAEERVAATVAPADRTADRPADSGWRRWF